MNEPSAKVKLDEHLPRSLAAALADLAGAITVVQGGLLRIRR